jgi:hypothetical protein
MNKGATGGEPRFRESAISPEKTTLGARDHVGRISISNDGGVRFHTAPSGHRRRRASNRPAMLDQFSDLATGLATEIFDV